MTIKEIEALTEYQKEVYKDVIMTKEDGKILELKIDKIQTTIDGITKLSKDNRDENIVLNKRMKSAEDWIDNASPKIGLKLEH